MQIFACLLFEQLKIKKFPGTINVGNIFTTSQNIFYLSFEQIVSHEREPQINVIHKGNHTLASSTDKTIQVPLNLFPNLEKMT